MIITIVTDSPADNASLNGSDQTKIIDDTEYLIGGDVIELEVIRSGDTEKTETVTVVLGQRPS